MHGLSAISSGNLKLSVLQRIRLRMFGRAYLGPVLNSAEKSKMNFYVFRCPEHGLQLDYPHGHEGALICPECLKQRANSVVAFSKKILSSPIQKADPVKSAQGEQPAKASSKGTGLLTRHKTMIGISVLGLMGVLAGYGIIKRSKD